MSLLALTPAGFGASPVISTDSITWDIIPTFIFSNGDTYPKSFAGIETTYLNDPQSLVVDVTLENINDPVFSYSRVNGGTITATAYPAASDTVSMVAHTTLINGVNPATDWAARSTAGGVLPGIENFSGYSNDTELHDGASFGTLAYLQSQLTTDTRYKTSGNGCLMERLPTEGTSSASWARYLSGAGRVLYPRIYQQVVFYLDENETDYAVLADQFPNQTTAPKILITSTVDLTNPANPVPNLSGEVVVDNQYNAGFYTAYRFNSTFDPFDEPRATPVNPNDFVMQPAIDRGTPANPTTKDEYEARYGPIWASGQIYVQGGQTLSSIGRPTVSQLIGGVEFLPNEFNVVTIFCDGPNQIFQMWAGRYGDAPDMIYDYQGDADFAVFDWDHITLTNYCSTGEPEPTRPIIRRSYCEVIPSTSPIDHPGGFPLPGNLG